MSSFASQIEETVRSVEASATSEAAKRYRSVLDELVTALVALGVGARIARDGGDPRILALYIYPQYRPQRGSRMLRFFIDGEKIEVSGVISKELESPGDLEKWLLEYVKLPAFIESLRELRDMAAQPVEARLRVNKRTAFHPDDVMVAVVADDQVKLGEARPGEEVTLRVTRINFPKNGNFAAQNYEVLNSAGILVDIAKINETLDKETREIVGTRSGEIEY